MSKDIKSSAWGNLLQPISAKKRARPVQRPADLKYKTSRTTEKCKKYLTQAENAVVTMFARDVETAARASAGEAVQDAKDRLAWITKRLTKLEMETATALIINDMDMTEFGSKIVPNASDKARCWGIGLGLYKSLAARLENLYLTMPKD